MSGDEQPAPILRVINADATPEEVAALVAVFSALGSAAERRHEATAPGLEQPGAQRPPDAPPRHRRLARQRPAALSSAATVEPDDGPGVLPLHCR